MGEPNYPDDLGSDLSTIRAQLRALQVLARSSRAKTKILAAAIDLLGRLLIRAGGRIEVQNAAGNVLLMAGQIPLSDGTMADGLAVFRPDGAAALAVFQAGAVFVPVIYDHAGNSVLLTDEVAGQGLVRPYIPIRFSDNVVASWAQVTAGTFTPAYAAAFYKQHAQVRLWVQVITPAGVTAEVELFDLDNSVQLAMFTVAAGANAGGELLTPISGAHGDVRNLAVRARVASGAGTVSLNVLSAYGRA